MSDFTDLIARAVSPSMTRAERDHVYGVIRQAVVRLQEREALSPDALRVALQRHLVEETIRDVEADIARFITLEQMEKAAAAQAAENANSR